MVLKPIWYSNQCIDVLNLLSILNISLNGDLKDYLVFTSDNGLALLISYYGYKIRLKFNGSILRQPEVACTQKK